MKHPFSRICAAILVAALVVLSGCDLTGSSTEGSLPGYWKSAYGDGFEISGNMVAGYQYTQYDDADRNVSFAGAVVNDPDFDASTGYIIIRITNGGSWGKTEGYYYAVHWKNLSGSLVACAAAFKTGGTNNNGMPTFVEALAEYTVANDYYGYYGDYEKQ